MWYELIPYLALAGAPAFVAAGIRPFYNWVMNNGHPYFRWTNNFVEQHYIDRDIILYGTYYKPTGLEAIPDEKQTGNQ